MSQSDGTDKILGYLDLSRSIDTWDVSWRSDSSPFLDAGNNWGAILFPETVPCYFFPSPIAKGPPQPQGSRQVGANHSQQLGLVDRLLKKATAPKLRDVFHCPPNRDP